MLRLLLLSWALARVQAAGTSVVVAVNDTAAVQTLDDLYQGYNIDSGSLYVNIQLSNSVLQQLVRNVGENFAGSLVLHINGDEPAFDLASRLNLFRIMQALLKHCVRFANTSWVEVTCRASADKLEITIDHDGGDSVWKETGAGSEMAVIEARCALLGSRMQVMGAGPGGSSRVCLMALPSPPQSPA